MTSKKPLNGYLDRMRTNIHALGESIEAVRKGSMDEKPADKRARLKLLRDLVELQNQTLVAVKGHLLGRDETGAIKEPEKLWDENPQVMFERFFKSQLSPWTEEDLKLECEGCGVKSEDVSSRSFEKQVPLGIADMTTNQTEQHNLCVKCCQKRLATKTAESP